MSFQIIDSNYGLLYYRPGNNDIYHSTADFSFTGNINRSWVSSNRSNDQLMNLVFLNYDGNNLVPVIK